MPDAGPVRIPRATTKHTRRQQRLREWGGGEGVWQETNWLACLLSIAALFCSVETSGRLRPLSVSVPSSYPSDACKGYQA